MMAAVTKRFYKMNLSEANNQVFKGRRGGKALQVYSAMLQNARYGASGYVNGVHLSVGQLITGQERLAEHTSLTRQNVRTAIESLKKAGLIDVKSSPAGSIVTVVSMAMDGIGQINQPRREAR